MRHRGTRAGILAWVALLATASLACRAALATVLDLPPPTAAAEPVPAPAVAAPAPGPALPAAPAADSARPEIEQLLHRDSILARLPRDRAGNVDWVAAMRHGTIKPRPALPGAPAPPPDGFRFAYDFTYQGPTPMFDAYFPHSAHTEIVACQQCHPRIFPYRNTPVVMADVLQGRYCGECHGTVAFAPATACERCHRQMTLPANRVQPTLLGDVTMGRVADTAGNAGRVDVTGLPRAVFPHSVHRIRYQCKACHMDVFEPRAGANQITMRAIADGEYCGECHDGGTAFRPDISNCQRCHVGTVAAP